ncbi:hypothetical protein L1987_11883 [Smallanthus sonchifolius]|uniref:Uncharacterized protein n=1 Tax=Smallanthus sonchifolius TaxID=185202 RepID=A0ACB9JEB3_9ASTR|nr:hypothetical protein L1987_11883 [Smallanthus sonchifolius]
MEAETQTYETPKKSSEQGDSYGILEKSSRSDASPKCLNATFGGGGSLMARAARNEAVLTWCHVEVLGIPADLFPLLALSLSTH